MRYSVHILYLSLFLVGALKSSLGEWVRMPHKAILAEKMFNGSKVELEEFFFNNMHRIKFNKELTRQVYVEICHLVAVAQILDKVSSNEGVVQKVGMADRFCFNMEQVYETTDVNQVIFTSSKYTKFKVPPLMLLNCHCKFNVSYFVELEFRVGEIIQDNPKVGLHWYFLQFDRYYRPLSKWNHVYELENSWAVLKKQEKYNISLKTINKYLIKYDIPHRRNLNIIKINRDKNGRFTFGIFEKPETKVLSHCNDNKIVKDSRMRKVSINLNNNNLIIKGDGQKENQSNKKFDYLSFIDNLEGFS